MNILTSTDSLGELCAQLSDQPYVAIDTEFMRDKTYWSRLCLIQLAAPGIEAIVDPMTDIDLEPLFVLLRDTRVVKVFHAGRQDIEIFFHRGRTIPEPVFDTQVAAMVCGFGDSISYDNLVRRILGEQIDKSSRFTDWARRPLTEKQLTYAMADVTHLRGVYESLSTRLKRSGRLNWLDEELSVLTAPETYTVVPEKAWERVKAKPKSKRALAVLVDVAAWREHEAQRQDVPRNRVMKDDALVEVAVNAPKSQSDLAMLRAVPKGFERSKAAGSLLEAVENGRHRPTESLPTPPQRTPLPGRLEPVVDLLRVLLRMQANRHKVAQRLIATTDDLEEIVRDDDADVPAMSGWRRELFGHLALDVKHGRLGMTVRNGRVSLVPTEPAQASVKAS